jgi:hypothetical protein
LNALKANSIGASSFSTIEYVSNGNDAKSNNVIGTIDGITTNIGSVSATITKNDGLSNESIVIGSNNRLVF